MSLFSEVALDDGRVITFRHGDDRDTGPPFRVGDPVPWQVDPERPGCGAYLDDAYLDDREEHWVLIKDHRIHAVVPAEDEIRHYGNGLSPDTVLKGGEDVQAEVMRQRHGITRLPPETWSLEAWGRHAIAQAHAERRHVAESAAIYDATPEQRERMAANYLASYTRAQMRESTYADHILRVLPPAPHVEEPSHDAS